MYLSKLTLDPRSPQARGDLSDPYQLHRTLMRAFPMADQGGPGRVLFRVEPQREAGPPVVLVQSEKPPNWAHLMRSGYASAEAKPIRLALLGGQRLRFRLRANPAVKRDGKRRGLVEEIDQRRWLERKAAVCGFRPVMFSVVRSACQRSFKPAGDDSDVQTHSAAEFEGILEVTDSERLTQAIRTGIGSAKGFGFGLMSVARA